MVPDPKAMRKAIMIAKAVASKVDPRFGNIQMPGVDQAIGNADGGIVEDHGKTYRKALARLNCSARC